ncbi:MAG: inositol monophosphatase [Mariniphaga sp.]|nr:inositol monophosphatase [Mariniphaga sp.]
MKNTLITALKTGGKTLLEYFDKPIEFIQKESQSSIVSIADTTSDLAIIKVIAESFPGHNIISEESGYANNNSIYTWIIDPLDGTSNFAAGIPWFGVMITLFKDNIPVMGGAYLPVSDTLYFAENGKGAYKNGLPLTMAKNRELSNSLIAFSVDYTADDIFLNKGIDIYKYIIKGSRNIRSTNSLVDFIYVAEGKFGGCINLFTKVWDISGLGLLISEAGGIMKDVYGNDIQYSIGNDIIERNFPVIAGSINIVESIRKIV